MQNPDCPVCKSRLLHPIAEPHTRELALNCPRCGPYRITFEALSMLQDMAAHDRRWAITSHAIRRMHAPNSEVFRATQQWLGSVWAIKKLPSPQEQADTLIDFLGSNNAPGDWIRCDPEHLAGLLGTVDDPTSRETEGFQYVATGLEAQRLIELEPLITGDRTVSYRLTFDGWARFEELHRRAVDSRIAFMAMGYNNEHVDRVFSSFIPAIAQTGFELRRLDQKPKAGLIDLRMRVEIRLAKFLVVDLTDENRGAYWESGFAEGLGKKVYYTCEASKFDTLKSHFDTEHLYTVKWVLDNLDPALDELKSAIRNDFPTEAIQSG